MRPVPCDGYVDNDALRLAVGPRLISEARASPCRRRSVFSFLDTASNLAASGECSRKRGRHHDQRSLGKTDFDLDAVPAASIMTHTASCRHAGWQSLGTPSEIFSCSCATAQLLSKAGLCVKVRTEFFCPRRVSDNEIQSRLHQSVVRKGGARDI